MELSTAEGRQAAIGTQRNETSKNYTIRNDVHKKSEPRVVRAGLERGEGPPFPNWFYFSLNGNSIGPHARRACRLTELTVICLIDIAIIIYWDVLQIAEPHDVEVMDSISPL